MVTYAPDLASPADVVARMTEQELASERYPSEAEILDGHVCKCEVPSAGESFYRMDKTEIVVCGECSGYYSAVLPNHGGEFAWR